MHGEQQCVPHMCFMPAVRSVPSHSASAVEKDQDGEFYVDLSIRSQHVSCWHIQPQDVMHKVSRMIWLLVNVWAPLCMQRSGVAHWSACIMSSMCQVVGCMVQDYSNAVSCTHTIVHVTNNQACSAGHNASSVAKLTHTIVHSYPRCWHFYVSSLIRRLTTSWLRTGVRSCVSVTRRWVIERHDRCVCRCF